MITNELQNGLISTYTKFLATCCVEFV